MERCPNCRARRRRDASECHRCGMSHELLLSVEAIARRKRRQAAQALLRGQTLEAERALNRARVLRDDPLLRQVAKFLEARKRATATRRRPPDP